MRDRLAAASLARLNAPDPETFQADARFALDALPALTTRPDQIKQLRQTILNLAVRGKLVPQDPNDEPASELLKRIAKEKVRLVKEGKAKRQDPLSEVDSIKRRSNYPLVGMGTLSRSWHVFGSGKSKHRPRNDPALFDGGEHLMIQTGDVARSQGVIETYTTNITTSAYPRASNGRRGRFASRLPRTSLTVGYLSFDACFPDQRRRVRPRLDVRDMQDISEYFVRTAKANLLESAPATAQKNINLEILNSGSHSPPTPRRTTPHRRQGR